MPLGQVNFATTTRGTGARRDALQHPLLCLALLRGLVALPAPVRELALS